MELMFTILIALFAIVALVAFIWLCDSMGRIASALESRNNIQIEELKAHTRRIALIEAAATRGQGPPIGKNL